MTLEMKMQDIRQEGKLEGALQNALETAKNLLKMGLTVEQVAQGTSLSVEQVRQLQKET